MIGEVSYKNVKITGGFWKKKQDMIRKTTVYAVYDRFVETGRFAAWDCHWEEGMPNPPSHAYDSDIAKWIEGVAYLTAQEKEPELEKIVDEMVDKIEKHRTPEGYFNSYYLAFPDKPRLENRSMHELYCAGHLIEAAVAYYEATGKDKFLHLMCDYADYIDERYRVRQDAGYVTPGHEEIELALVRLYDCTKNEKYLDLARFFLDMRGQKTEAYYNGENPEYDQAHKPVREQREAVGHAVRAMYLYIAMADVAVRRGDAELLKACYRLFDDVFFKKMYVSGGIGSSTCGESFTLPYDLPNLVSYTESCAAIAYALFSQRMTLLDQYEIHEERMPDSRYADAFERILYNGFLSAISLDGKSFFYENPLEIIPYLADRDSSPKMFHHIHFPQMHREEVFECSCCPPNILRFMASLGGRIYSTMEDYLLIHQYISNEADITVGEKKLHVTVKTDYPKTGKVRITVRGGDVKLALRVPFWCKKEMPDTSNGYARYTLMDGETLAVDFGMPVQWFDAHPNVKEDCVRSALMRGPVLYCAEGIDNGENLRDLRFSSTARFREGRNKDLDEPTLTTVARRRAPDGDNALYRLHTKKTEKVKVTLIPYHAFANRGVCEMQVWHYVQ